MQVMLVKTFKNNENKYIYCLKKYVLICMAKNKLISVFKKKTSMC
jgi:hypothetical protein